ncbi:MAG: hypothetical protein NC123_09285 [Butyrivibrio sp.]|nr:hypothetical protein [Acetatifactor muris]MCM1559727.1 hypothetical protein [Butyrivibrio sp.]
MKKEKGSIGDLLAACICMVLMTLLLVSYMDSVRLVDEKTEINQIARKYILRMETVGMLTESDRRLIERELEAAGASEVSLEGTTFERVGYGEEIVLKIRGKLRGIYGFEEKRMSTAKY